METLGETIIAEWEATLEDPIPIALLVDHDGFYELFDTVYHADNDGYDLHELGLQMSMEYLSNDMLEGQPEANRAAGYFMNGGDDTEEDET